MAREISQNWVCGLKKLVENETMTQQPMPGTGGTPLKPLLDAQHPLVVFTEQIDWDTLRTTFETSYQDEGRPSVPVRILVGLHCLKTLNNESDESVVASAKWSSTKTSIDFATSGGPKKSSSGLRKSSQHRFRTVVPHTGDLERRACTTVPTRIF